MQRSDLKGVKSLCYNVRGIIISTMSNKKPKLSTSIKKELRLETRLTFGKVLWPVLSLVLAIAVSGYLFTVYKSEKTRKEIQSSNPEDKIQNKPEVKEEESMTDKQEGQREEDLDLSKIPTPPQPQYENYTVEEGDTLGAIASAKGVTVDEILAANPGLVAESLQIGAIIKIPKK